MQVLSLKFRIFAIANQLSGFSISKLANVEDFFNGKIYFLNVNINVSINDHSFKYICVVCYLKLRFFASLVQSQISEILILKIEILLGFQNKTNIEIIGF